MTVWQPLGNNLYTHVSKPYEVDDGVVRDSNTKKPVLDLVDLSQSPPFSPLSLLFPPGIILPYGGTTSPNSSFLLLAGQNVSRTTYALLFAVLGTTFGAGDGSTTFGLPDTRSSYLRGVGSNPAFIEPRTIILGQLIEDQFQGHKFELQSLNGVLNNSVYGTGGSKVGNPIDTNPTDTTKSFITTNPITDGTNGTPRTGNETAVKGLGVNYLITTGL